METRFKGQKLQIPAARIEALPANFVKQDNAKVKVQYIQNHQIVEKNITQTSPVVRYATAGIDVNEVEAENVEYLDESTSEEQPSKLLQLRGQKTKESFKDTFYPNAIHCLIDLYKRKYSEMKGKTEEQIRMMCIWDQIAKDMNECLFRFSRSEIKQKFIQLRSKYFCIGSAEEADAFEYFDQLHDLYQDKFVDAIAAGGFKQGETEKTSNCYRDEQLLLEDDADEEQIEDVEQQQQPQQLAAEPDEHNYQAATAQEVTVQTHNDDEIAHKEHEFIDMVEKELQAIVEGRDEGIEVTQEIVSNEMILHQQEEVVTHEEVGSYEASTTEIVQRLPTVEQAQLIKREKPEEESVQVQEQNAKRFKLDIKAPAAVTTPHVVRLHLAPAPAQQHPQINSFQMTIPEAVNCVQHKEMTLASYNAQQERRHQEKMNLLRKSLELQERAIETQRHLMEELIKRL